MSTQVELRLPTPETLREQVVLEEHDLAPDGSFAVVTRRAVDGEDYVSHLWLVPLDGGEARRLTHGRHRDVRPRISPDGIRVAFSRSAPRDDRKHIRILDLRGGEAVVPSLGDLDPAEVAWSPDSTRLRSSTRMPVSGRGAGVVSEFTPPSCRTVLPGPDPTRTRGREVRRVTLDR